MECLRKVRHVSGYVLTIWDTHQTTKDQRSIIRYDFRHENDAEPIFSSPYFFSSRYYSTDSDESILDLLGFLTLRKGDISRKYFDAYTEVQLAWSESPDCETLAGDVALINKWDNFYFTDVFTDLEF